jgi:hypothetical protein
MKSNRFDLVPITLYEVEGKDEGDNSRSIYFVTRIFNTAIEECLYFLDMYDTARITPIETLGLA